MRSIADCALTDDQEEILASMIQTEFLAKSLDSPLRFANLFAIRIAQNDEMIL
jgi:hypothetical protein